MQQIIIKRVNKPQEKSFIDNITWLCESFGLSSGRDIYNTSTRVVTEILTLKHYQPISTDLLARELEMNVGRINHHLRSLIDLGLFYREKRHLYLRGGSLQAAVKEIRKDTDRVFDEIEDIASIIDRKIIQ